MTLNNEQWKDSWSLKGLAVGMVVILFVSGLAIGLASARWYRPTGESTDTSSWGITEVDGGGHVFDIDTSGIELDNVSSVELNFTSWGGYVNSEYDNVSHTHTDYNYSYDLVDQYDREATVGWNIELTDGHIPSNISLSSASDWDAGIEFENVSVVDDTIELDDGETEGYWLSDWFEETVHGYTLKRVLNDIVADTNVTIGVRGDAGEEFVSISPTTVYDSFQIRVFFGLVLGDTTWDSSAEATLTNPSAFIRTFGYNLNETYYAIGSGHYIYVYDVSDWSLVHSDNVMSSNVHVILWTDDGDYLVVGAGNRIYTYAFGTWQKYYRGGLGHSSHSIQSLLYLEGDDYFYAVDSYNNVRQVYISNFTATGLENTDLDGGVSWVVNADAISLNGEYIFVNGDTVNNGYYILYASNLTVYEHVTGLDIYPTHMEVSTCGGYITLWTNNNQWVRVLDRSGNFSVVTYMSIGSGGRIYNTHLSDDYLMVHDRNDEATIVYYTSNWSLAHTFTGYTSVYSGLRFSPDGLYAGMGRTTTDYRVYYTSNWTVAENINIGFIPQHTRFSANSSTMLVFEYIGNYNVAVRSTGYTYEFVGDSNVSTIDISFDDGDNMIVTAYDRHWSPMEVFHEYVFYGTWLNDSYGGTVAYLNTSKLNADTVWDVDIEVYYATLPLDTVEGTLSLEDGLYNVTYDFTDDTHTLTFTGMNFSNMDYLWIVPSDANMTIQLVRLKVVTTWTAYEISSMVGVFDALSNEHFWYIVLAFMLSTAVAFKTKSLIAPSMIFLIALGIMVLAFEDFSTDNTMYQVLLLGIIAFICFYVIGIVKRR